MPKLQQDIQTEDTDSEVLYVGLRLEAERAEESKEDGGVRLTKCTECKREFYADHILKTTCSYECTMGKGRRRNNARRRK